VTGRRPYASFMRPSENVVDQRDPVGVYLDNDREMTAMDMMRRDAFEAAMAQPTGYTEQARGSYANPGLSEYVTNALRAMTPIPRKAEGGEVSEPSMLDRAMTLAGRFAREGWPARMAKSAVSAAQLPGDVYAGKTTPNDPSYYDRATDLAGMVMGGGSLGGVPKGSVGSTFSEPLYHGSPRTNLHFLNPSERGPLGPGLYASPSESIAKSYAGPEGRIYEMPEVNRDIYRGAGHRTDEEWAGFKADKQRLIDAAEPEKRDAISKMLDSMWSGDGYPAYQRLVHMYGGDEGAQNLFRRAGFEGISGQVDGPETVLFGKHTHPVKPQDRAEGGPVWDTGQTEDSITAQMARQAAAEALASPQELPETHKQRSNTHGPSVRIPTSVQG
jgi:hypothetical protein